jgi:multidrug resistance protein, MATE family
MSSMKQALGADLGMVLRHAGTMLIGQLAVMAFTVTDTIVAGRFSPQALAALSVAGAINISVYVTALGVVQALLPIYAELHGAQQPRALGSAFRQALYLGALVMVLGMAVLLFPTPLLVLAQVPPDLQPLAQQYISIMAWALAPTLAFRMFSALNQATGSPRVVTLMQIAALIIKVPLTVWFTFGGWGLPAMGLAGCAWSSFLVNWLLFLGAAWGLRTRPRYAPLEVFAHWEKPDLTRLALYARLGVPAGLAYMIEVTSFTLMALLIARQGVQATAAHSVASNVVAVLYMIPLTISIAGSARVSYWIGAGDESRGKQLARLNVGLTLGIAACASSLMWLLAKPIASAYSPDPAIVALAVALLGWVALYHFFDAAQSICSFTLRCWRITLMPLAVYTVCLWGGGLGLGFALAYHGLGPWPATHNPQAFWISGAISLGTVALIFGIKLWRVTRTPLPPSASVERAV